MPDTLANLLSTAVRPSRNVQSYPVNWPAFMAEQLRNVPTLGESNPGPVPPPLGGQLGQLSNAAGDYLNRTMATSPGPQHPFARYVIPNPDQPYYDPTSVWDRQHR